MLIMFGHLGIATALQDDIWRLSDADADAYCKATTEFLRWHMPSFAPTGKTGSTLALVATLGMVYAPRAMVVIARRHQGLARAPTPETSPRDN